MCVRENILETHNLNSTITPLEKNISELIYKTSITMLSRFWLPREKPTTYKLPKYNLKETSNNLS